MSGLSHEGDQRMFLARKKMYNILGILLVLSFFHLFSEQGIEYSCMELRDPSGSDREKKTIHILKVDPLLYDIKPARALDNGIGRESVLSLAKRHGATASVNGGFFAIGGAFDGQSRGALKIRNWVALPWKPRGCIGWSRENQHPNMDRLLVEAKLHYRCKTLSIDGLNRPRKDGEAVIYTPCFHRTTLTNPDGKEVVVIDGVVTAIFEGGSTKIPENGFVVSIQEKHSSLPPFSIGDSLTFSFEIKSLLEPSFKWNSFEYIVGGTPLLLHSRVENLDFTEEQHGVKTFLSNRHARTAVGILEDGTWVFVVVDQTKDKLGEGMTIYELTDFLQSLGCIFALNLDGGGSSTMVYEGEIKNCPRGNEDEGFGKKVVRRVSDAILVCPISRREEVPSY